MRWVSAIAVVVASALACGTHAPPDRLIVQIPEAGVDAAADGSPGVSSDDAGPSLGAPCLDDAQCDDAIPCTYDSCDKTAGRCLNVPDDTQCDDGIYCDGREQCAPGHGCVPGPVVSCSDGNPCDIARCVEATRSCTHSARDVDQDGDPDEHCAGGGDCNDLDPNVSSLHAEVCGNGIDDNCNGQIDEMPCVVAHGASCDSPYVVAGPGTYSLSTVGARLAFSTSCSVTNPAGAQNVVAEVTVPPGGNSDLEVWATTTGVEVAAAIEAACGESPSEIACSSAPMATSVRARGHNLAPGTYYVVVTTQTPSPFEIEVTLLPPTPPATNVGCASATPFSPGTPIAVALADPSPKLPSVCPSSTGELTYSFSLAQAQDVRIYATVVRGTGKPVIGLRDATCTAGADELGCQIGGALPVFARGLAAGRYVVTVAGTSTIDATVDVELSAPTQPPADETCGSPPPLPANGRVAFDLSNHAQAIRDGCFSSSMNFSGGADAAYTLTLAGASDVLLVGRLPSPPDVGALSLDPPACDLTYGCSTGGGPLRLGRRNVPPGDYRAVIADEFGQQGTLDALVRPTIPPVIVPPGGADVCPLAMDLGTGGFFTGDTSTATANYSNPCDAPTAAPGGAPDQVFRLNLAQPQRVVFDMEGSSYTTILDVRQGATCPGTPIASGCYVGFTAERSFLDVDLQAGQYWILVDGYNGASGAWDLDVRLLPPTL